MRKKITVACAALCLGVLVTSDPIAAHHAFSSEFDAAKPVRLHGKITRMEWLNPHSWVHVEVEKDGSTVTWMIEAGPPGALVRRGWRKDFVKLGIEVLVEGYQAIHGSNRVNGRDVTLPNGVRLFAGFSGTGAPYDDSRSADSRR